MLCKIVITQCRATGVENALGSLFWSCWQNIRELTIGDASFRNFEMKTRFSLLLPAHHHAPTFIFYSLSNSSWTFPMSDQISSTSRFFPCQHFPRLWQSGAISGPIPSQMWCKCSIVVAPRFPRGCPAITRQSMGVWRQPRNGDWKIERFMKLDNFYFIAPCRNTNCDRILAI